MKRATRTILLTPVNDYFDELERSGNLAGKPIPLVNVLKGWQVIRRLQFANWKNSRLQFVKIEKINL